MSEERNESVISCRKVEPMCCQIDPASFRDPSGFMFWHDGAIFRQVNQTYRDQYDLLMCSGLYSRLVERGWLIEHHEVKKPIGIPASGYVILKPEQIDFVSYPYEWCFSQLKDAALRTLDIQREAILHGMTLKDASAYNIQFHGGKPVLIDTLSFECYVEGLPWVAYRQFCRHFLAPLALMAKKDVRLSQLLRVYIDGVPLDLASELLPRSTWFGLGLAIHLHLHAKIQSAFSDTTGEPRKAGRKSRLSRVSKTGLLGLLESLRGAVEKLKWQPAGTEWADYYAAATNYTDSAFEGKKSLVRSYLEAAKPKRVWDMGANTGVFSRIASQGGILSVAFDIDPAAVEINYQQVKSSEESRLLPLVLDLTNPSPSLGWDNTERRGLLARGSVDCAMALALVHHLAISNNVPLPRVASFFAGICRWLIIEFVPKSDSQAQRLLRSREDIFHEYDQAHFERVFSRYFRIHKSDAIEGSERTLYLMENN